MDSLALEMPTLQRSLQKGIHSRKSRKILLPYFMSFTVIELSAIFVDKITLRWSGWSGGLNTSICSAAVIVE